MTSLHCTAVKISDLGSVGCVCCVFCKRALCVFQASLSIWGWGGLGVVLFLVTFGPFAVFYLAFYIFCFIGGWATSAFYFFVIAQHYKSLIDDLSALNLTSIFQGFCGYFALWKDQLRETPRTMRTLLLTTHTNWYNEGKSPKSAFCPRLACTDKVISEFLVMFCLSYRYWMKWNWNWSL